MSMAAAMIPQFSIHVIIVFVFLSFQVLLSYQQTSFSFPSFTNKFQRWEDRSTHKDGNIVLLQRNATVSEKDGGIDLTTNINPSVGRVIYPKPVRIWNKKTENMACFTTEFTFSIENFTSKRNESYLDGGDGFAFFLLPHSEISVDAEANARLFGLTNHPPYVAVEFDTCKNEGNDRSGSHVGIDVDTVDEQTFTVNVPLKETVIRATVKFNAATRNLTVSLLAQDHPHLNGGILLSREIDIRTTFRLEENVVVGFAAASSKDWVQRHRILNWTFTSTPLEDNSKQKVIVGTGVGVGLLVISVCIILAFFFFRKKTKDKRKVEDNDDDDEEMCDIDGELEDGTGQNPRRFPYKVLANATDDFNPEAKIGQGGFGSVYRGFLSDLNLEVAIKRVSRDSKQGKKEYVSEIKIISRLRHKNLVQLVGWCHRKSDLLLVYELMPKGSLDFHLFNKTSFLPWRLRYKIALELASGLLYLHEEWEKCVVHRDVKSSNVMLDSSFNAKLGDFGLARLSEHGLGLQTTFMAGTLGYMAPECLITGKVSKEADVYSFGVVALELACGRKSVDQLMKEGNEVRLVEWVWGMYGKGMLLEALDKRFESEEDVVDDDQARRLMVVGLSCAHPDINHRPSIRQAINVLNLEKSIPNLPPNMPVPTYTSLSPLNAEVLDLTTSSTSITRTTPMPLTFSGNINAPR